MATLVKIENSTNGKKLLAYLKSLDFVKVVGDTDNLVDLKELKGKVSKAEKSRSLSLDEAIRKSELWKGRK